MAIATSAEAQTFVPTSGSASWNDDGNWSSPPYPNLPDDAATIPAATGNLTIDLNEAITLGTLSILKPDTNVPYVTTIQEGAGPGAFTFSGTTPKLINAATQAAPLGTGATIIDVPISFSGSLTVEQNDNTGLQLRDPITSSGINDNLTIQRVGTGNAGSGVVAISGSNSYSGATILRGAGGPEVVLVRLNNANAIPGGLDATGGTSNIAFRNSAVLGLGSGDFRRGLGTGPDQFQMLPNSEPVALDRAIQSGWAAFVADRVVNIGGASAQVVWNSAHFGPNILTLGHTTADKTITFENPIDLYDGSSAAAVERNIRAANGSAATDAVISGSLTSSNTSGLANVLFRGSGNTNPGGTVRLTAANSYSGITSLTDGVVVVLDHPDALSPTNLNIMTGNSVLGLGSGSPTFTRSLGTGDGQVRITGQAGFAAYGGDRIVNLGGNETPDTVTWGGGTGFVPSGSAFVLSMESSDGMVDFQNGINLNNGARIFAVRDGSAPIDARLSGEIQGPLSASGLTKNFAGTLELTANNTYGGTTLINGGTLLVNNTPVNPGDSGTGAGNVTVANTGTLGGTGSVAGIVTVNSGGAIAPGLGIESLTIGGAILADGSFLDFELGASGVADLLDVTNALEINGGTVRFFDGGGIEEGSYTIIDYGSLTGSAVSTFLSQTPTGPSGFSFELEDTGSTIVVNVEATTLPGDHNNDGVVDILDYVVWRIDPDNNGGPDGYDDWTENYGNPPGSGTAMTSAVPEPGTIVMLALAIPFFFTRRVVRSHDARIWKT